MPQERLGRAEALRAFSWGGAYAASAETRRGILREGMDADFTVFGADVLRIDVDDLPHAPVAATVVGGRVEYGSPR